MARKMQKKLMYALCAAVAVVLLAAAYAVVSGAFSPTVAQGDTVQVYYTGAFTNGTVFGSNLGGQPLNFTVGSDQVIQGFGLAVIGMRLNQAKTVEIPANEAYGEVNPQLIIKVPLSAFGNRTVQEGMMVTENSTSGEMQGTVTSVNSTTATIDFNPPLAGQTLVFTIRVVGINGKEQ